MDLNGLFCNLAIMLFYTQCLCRFYLTVCVRLCSSDLFPGPHGVITGTSPLLSIVKRFCSRAWCVCRSCRINVGVVEWVIGVLRFFFYLYHQEILNMSDSCMNYCFSAKVFKLGSRKKCQKKASKKYLMLTKAAFTWYSKTVKLQYSLQ